MEGPAVRLDRQNGQFVLSGDFKGPSHWRIEQREPQAWQGTITCSQYPCVLPLEAGSDRVVLARRLDAPGRTEWAGSLARAKAQYGALVRGENEMLRVYRAR